uniref:Uncharacterized protein n=1 Tax=Siphoviridae sp. ctXQ014 TaxID=2825542 RepID=A0A8S5PLZ0_9CAUD|nr:MAG TPA: hypothetical protein [Siphoviridae sp. ctXQ014]DAL61812.1 MAG TPA_asm: hypothetical protein [Caudoviricetes sp.]
MIEGYNISQVSCFWMPGTCTAGGLDSWSLCPAVSGDKKPRGVNPTN